MLARQSLNTELSPQNELCVVNDFSQFHDYICSESTGNYSGSGSGTGREANPRLPTNLSNVLNGKIASDLN